MTPRQHKPPQTKTKTPPSSSRSALKQSVRIVHHVCCVAGAHSLIDDTRSAGAPHTLGSAIERLDTPALFDWLVDALSYQGISDRAASAYIQKHGSVTWLEIEYRLSKRPSCPKLKSYWHFHGCGYTKTSGTCSHPEHYSRCPLPKHRLRNGRLNQTAYSLFFFLRDHGSPQGQDRCAVDIDGVASAHWLQTDCTSSRLAHHRWHGLLGPEQFQRTRIRLAIVELVQRLHE